jgi:17beta-estradiol 17-dehydrogenase / very-long-chain 3-oxoacyl-CoA reductase
MIKKRRGLIVNVSSVSGRRPTPLLGLYSGTKGFVDLFSRFVKYDFQFHLFLFFLFNYSSLAAECVSRGVYVQSLCPGYVVSKLSGIRKASLIAPTPEQFVLSALDRVALPFTTGYWTHELQVKKIIIII